jgi:hypothetical protein
MFRQVGNYFCVVHFVANNAPITQGEGLKGQNLIFAEALKTVLW